MTQRTRTRDLIYDFIPPNPVPGFPPNHGSGTVGKLIFNNIKDFPDEGRYDVLYFNRDNNTLYCWDGEENGYVFVNAGRTEYMNIDGGGAADG